jgi:hypothetical protein
MHKNTGARAGWILRDLPRKTEKVALESLLSKPFLRSRLYHIDSDSSQPDASPDVMFAITT